MWVWGQGRQGWVWARGQGRSLRAVGSKGSASEGRVPGRNPPGLQTITKRPSFSRAWSFCVCGVWCPTTPVPRLQGTGVVESATHFPAALRDSPVPGDFLSAFSLRSAGTTAAAGWRRWRREGISERVGGLRPPRPMPCRRKQLLGGAGKARGRPDGPGLPQQHALVQFTPT